MKRDSASNVTSSTWASVLMGFRAQFYLFVSFAVIGCTEPVQVASAFPNTPFRELQGVHVGMTARALRNVRQLEFAPYRGFRETLDGVGILYQFPPGSAGETRISNQSRLQQVWATVHAGSIGEARSLWADAVERAATAYGEPVGCGQVPGSSPGALAIWRVRDLWLEISAHEAFSTGSELVSDRLVYIVSEEERSRGRSELSSASCSSLLESLRQRRG